MGWLLQHLNRYEELSQATQLRRLDADKARFGSASGPRPGLSRVAKPKVAQRITSPAIYQALRFRQLGKGMPSTTSCERGLPDKPSVELWNPQLCTARPSQGGSSLNAPIGGSGVPGQLRALTFCDGPTAIAQLGPHRRAARRADNSGIAATFSSVRSSHAMPVDGRGACRERQSMMRSGVTTKSTGTS